MALITLFDFPQLSNFSHDRHSEALTAVLLLLKQEKPTAELLKHLMAREVSQNDKFVNMIEAGIIDPALVSKTALTNAASVAGLMLTTDVLVTELKEDAEPVTGAKS